MSAVGTRQRKIEILGLAVVLAVGIFVRLPHSAFSNNRNPLHALEFLHPQPKMDALGFDEGMYRSYLNAVIDQGLGAYPEIVEDYIAAQEKLTGSVLPPVRFLFIFAAYIWHLIFRTEALASLHQV